jgi:hypothetical protein
MTSAEFVNALKEIGATNIELRTEFVDWWSALGVAVQCRLDGRLIRYGVRLSLDAPIEGAFPLLLDAIKEKAAEQAA